MMKKLSLLVVVCLSVLTGCNKDEMTNVMEGKKGVITATMEQGSPISRLAIADDNTLSWEAGDAFTVFAGSDSYIYTFSEGSTFNPEGGQVPEDATDAVAAFPNISGLAFENNKLTMTLPASYNEGEQCELPMWGELIDGNVSFKHLAGVLRVNLNNLPTGCNAMTITASNPIAGSFTANVEDGEPVLVASEGATNSVTLSFEAIVAEGENKDRTLYLPLPTGTYESIQVSVTDGTNTYVLANWSNKTVARATIYTANATYTEVASIDELKAALAAVNENNKNAHIVVTEQVSGNLEITGPNFEGTSVTLDFENVADNTNLTIKAPKSTVELGLGSFASITATTAENTLIIGEAVTVGTLTINGGNVVLKGQVKNIQCATGITPTITLGGDIILNEMVTIASGSTVTIDLNGNAISFNEDKIGTTYAINNLGTLTLKDTQGEGSVNARGIYNGYDAGGNYVTTAQLTIESGTYNAKGANGGAAVFNYGALDINGGSFTSVGGYAVNNQAGAIVTIDNANIRGGLYNMGNATINEGSDVYQHISGRHAIYNYAATLVVNGGEFDSESGNELILADGQDSSVTLNGGTFDKTGKSYLYSAATGKNITFTITGGTHNGYVNSDGTVDTFRTGQPIEVTGGTFNFDVTAWKAADKTVIDNEDGTWTVQ